MQSKNLRGMFCLVIAMVLTLFISTQYLNPSPKPKAKVPKVPKAPRAMGNDSYKMAMLLSFNNGYKTCLLDVIDVAIEANENGDINELYDYIYAKSKEVCK